MEITTTATKSSGLIEKVGAAPPETLIFGEGSKAAAAVATGTGRAEVDTSAPFESVKEAVDRFGGSAIWKYQLKQLFHHEKHHSVEEVELLNVQEQAAQLENDLILKEQDTLEVLKELERIKRTVDSLKAQLHDELFEVVKLPAKHTDNVKLHSPIESEGEISSVDSVHAGTHAKQSPGSFFVDVKQAKMNLSRITSDLANVRASVESLSSELEEEKALLENIRKDLSSKRAVIFSLEEDLKQMTGKLQLTKEVRNKCNGDPAVISEEIKHLITERDHFRRTTEATKSEVLRLTSEIEQTKASIKASKIRWLAAKKMEEAAKAAEDVAVAQSKALTNSNSPTVCLQNHPAVVLCIEDYIMLTQKVQEADESSRKKIEAALLEVEKANKSNLEIVAKVEEAAADVKTSKKVLNDALNYLEAANRGKLTVEEALRRWRSEHGQRRCFAHNSIKFKNSYTGHHRRHSRILDLNGLNLINDDPRNELKHTLSIGEILSRKLMGPEDDDYDTGIPERLNGKVKVSLGQILNRRPEVLSPQNGCGSALKRPTKRKKFDFVGFSHLLKNEAKKSNKCKRKLISGLR